MIRFVDLTAAYWADDEENMRENPCCAFLDTVTDTFIIVNGCHIFDCDDSFDDLKPVELATRCRALVPDGFWK